MTEDRKMELQLFAGKTKIEDVIVPEVFNGYVVERTAKKSALYQSNIIQQNSEFDALAASGGKLLNMPFWQDLDSEDQVLRDDQALDVNKIQAKKDVAALLMRGNAWSANDLAQALSGDDPMAAIGDLVADYWARRWQKILLSILEGVFESADMSNNVHDITQETDSEIDGKTAIDAIQKLGDAKDRLTGFVVHSATEAALAKNDLIDYIQPSEGSPMIPTFLGKNVIVDDGMPKNGDEYTTYIFGEGAIALGEGGAPVPTETDRDSLAGDDILINRRHFILHPRGVKFTDNDVDATYPSPTNDDLKKAANWERVYEPKNVRIVKFKHKL